MPASAGETPPVWRPKKVDAAGSLEQILNVATMIMESLQVWGTNLGCPPGRKCWDKWLGSMSYSVISPQLKLHL